MYPNTPTYTEEVIQAIVSNSPKVTDIIKDYIEKHQSEVYKMQKGVKYYYKENDITNRVIYKYLNDGSKVIDHEATNNKLASGYHKLLVDQKTSYLVGEPITISSKSDKDIQPVIDTLGGEFDDTLPELVTAASNKGREWLHPYITKDGEFDYIIIPAEEFIPIYDNTKRKSLIAGIRYYSLDDDTVKIELWDDNYVTYYEQTNQGINLDYSYGEPRQSHFHRQKGEQKLGYGWKKVPFIEFANNSKRVSDLTFYKDFIDAYDNILSDTTNTLEDVQQFLYVIKGYEGQDIAEAVTNFKRFKGVAVSSDDNSGVDILQGEVPMQSVTEYLNRVKDDVFQFGQGVDITADKYGNSPSGIALKFLFSLLDMKASVLKRKFEKGLREFCWFVCEYLEISGKAKGMDCDDIQFTFNSSMLMNEFEHAQIAQISKGIISDRTIAEEHPWSRNDEYERLQEQQDSLVDLMTPVVDDNE
jgi:SPP1 family phage portal protein